MVNNQGNTFGVAPDKNRVKTLRALPYSSSNAPSSNPNLCFFCRLDERTCDLTGRYEGS